MEPPQLSKAGYLSSINNSTTSPGQHGSNGGGGGKFRKEDWYPIYIRGIRLLDEKELKDHLSKKFGELKFLKSIKILH